MEREKANDYYMYSRVDLAMSKKLKNASTARWTYFIRGKMETSASIKSSFTRSAYSWAHCNSWIIAVDSFYALFHFRFNFSCNFIFSSVWCKVTSKQQKNLDEREKMHTGWELTNTPIERGYAFMYCIMYTIQSKLFLQNASKQ